VLNMLNFIVGTVAKHLRNQRGVVSVEWIILAIVIMVAIVAAFAPQFQAALQAGVQSVSTTLSSQAAGAGS
jgi:Flp pilus assembly pilin Flp